MGAVLNSLFAGKVTPGGEHGWFPMALAGGTRTTSGEYVSPQTAFKLSAAYACVRVIAEDVAKLPFGVYERQQPSGRKELETHNVTRLIGLEPNDIETSVTFWGDLVADAASWHGGFARITKRGANITKLERMDPALVSRRLDPQDGLMYDYRPDGAGSVESLAPNDVLDVRGLGVGLNGWSLTRFASEALGLGIAAQRHNAAYYGNGLNTNISITHPATLGEKALRNLRDSISARSGAKGSFTPLLLEEGMTIGQLSAGLEDSQNVELRQFQVEEVCRYWRVNPNKVQHWLRTTFNNVSESNLDHVTDTLMPWLLRVEQECDRKLLRKESPRLFTKHRIDAMLWGKPIERAELMQTQFNTGALSINDMMDALDRPQIGPEGDIRFVNGNLVPIHQIANGNQAYGDTNTSEDIKDESSEDSTAATTGEPSANAVEFEIVADAQEQVIAHALAGILRKEQNAVDRASKKDGDLLAWWADWSDKHAHHVRDAIAPPVEALARMLRVDVVPILIEYSADHIALSGAILNKATDIGEHADLINDRPQRAAATIVAQIMEIQNGNQS